MKHARKISVGLIPLEVGLMDGDTIYVSPDYVHSRKKSMCGMIIDIRSRVPFFYNSLEDYVATSSCNEEIMVIGLNLDFCVEYPKTLDKYVRLIKLLKKENKGVIDYSRLVKQSILAKIKMDVSAYFG